MALLEDEVQIWSGRPNWRAWPGLTVLGFILAPVVIGLIILAWLGIKKRSIAWRITNKRIEIERGWLSRRIDTVELWRAHDVEFQQSVSDRFVGISTIVVTSQDERLPALTIRCLPNDRSVYDPLMKAVMLARQQRGMMNLNQ